jgi:hypothetical protein
MQMADNDWRDSKGTNLQGPKQAARILANFEQKLPVHAQCLIHPQLREASGHCRRESAHRQLSANPEIKCERVAPDF